MSNINFTIKEDIKLIRELLNLSQEQFANKIDVNTSTLKRWEHENFIMKDSDLNKIYAYAFKNHIYLNEIKAQLYQEEIIDKNMKVLFHGAKNAITGGIDVNHARGNNEFGQGFYCGESFEQSAQFVCGFENSSVYVLEFDAARLSNLTFSVNQDWMLTIAYFRGRLKHYEHSSIIKTLLHKLDNVDYIIAPIADNRMFQIIDSFIDGDITDEQCKHCLAATNLGYQYVFKTQDAVKKIRVLERFYLCNEEKKMYQAKRLGDNKLGESKIKIAKRQYRGQGHYIDEIL